MSCHALVGINIPQTLKIEGYIKNKKVTVLIDLGSTFVYPPPEFQVTIVDGGTINCSEKCHNINLTMAEYVLNSTMISIPMVVLMLY